MGKTVVFYIIYVLKTPQLVLKTRAYLSVAFIQRNTVSLSEYISGLIAMYITCSCEIINQYND